LLHIQVTASQEAGSEDRHVALKQALGSEGLNMHGGNDQQMARSGGVPFKINVVEGHAFLNKQEGMKMDALRLRQIVVQRASKKLFNPQYLHLEGKLIPTMELHFFKSRFFSVDFPWHD
jgi:hypothetical protein